MSLSRRNPRRDANEKPIREALEAVGVEVWPISGKNRPDLLCCYRGRWMPLAVKMPKGALTDDEKQGVKWPLVRTPGEAFEALGIKLVVT